LNRHPLVVALVLGAALFGCGRRSGGDAPDAGGVGGHAGSVAGVGGATGGAGQGGVAGTSAATGGGGTGAGTAGMFVSTGGASPGGATGGADRSGTGGGSAGGNGGAGAASGGRGGMGPVHPLGLNDVTILVPLPGALATPVLLLASDRADDGSALVPRTLVDQLVLDGSSGKPLPTLDTAYDRLHVVAVRFALCDRPLPGACPTSDDARMRLVLQPIDSPGSAQDTGFHAFYTIGNAEIPAAVAALRDLASLVPADNGPLRVSPALSAANPAPYAEKLRAFVRRYGGGRLVRLTMNAQNLLSAQVAWELRGVQKQDDAFVAMTIAGGTEVSERVALSGTTSYDVMPATDTPTGLRTALLQWMFDAMDAEKQRLALASLVAVEDPLRHTADTVACVACHVSTVVLNARTSGNTAALPGRYTSTFNLSTAGGKSAETPRTIRALGYLRQDPMISQRVVNETAQTLQEIEQRYPLLP